MLGASATDESSFRISPNVDKFPCVAAFAFLFFWILTNILSCVMADGVDELIHFGYVASLSSCGFLPAACCKIVNENPFQISPISILLLVL